jgi:penicillin-binding protein 1A
MGGKTGTTQNQSDGYFMGITPNLVTGVWTGCEDRSAHFRSILYGQGANMALPIFAEYMQRVYADTSETGIYPIDFDIPQLVNLKLDCGEVTNNIVDNEIE